MSFTRAHDLSYYGNPRSDFQSMIPTGARTILDVGCGTGALGAVLKSQRADRRVLGIERYADAAREAEKVLDEVFCGDIENMPLPIPPASLDCIVCADVLEHLVDPLGALQRLRPLLSGDGTLVCSIPNVRHYTSILRLVLQGWSYDDSGIFDRTHLRFFSRSSLCELLRDAGFPRFSLHASVRTGGKMGFLHRRTRGLLEEFVAFQYFVVAHRAGSP